MNLPIFSCPKCRNILGLTLPLVMVNSKPMKRPEPKMMSVWASLDEETSNKMMSVWASFDEETSKGAKRDAKDAHQYRLEQARKYIADYEARAGRARRG
jgi:hypothetical protein